MEVAEYVPMTPMIPVPLHRFRTLNETSNSAIILPEMENKKTLSNYISGGLLLIVFVLAFDRGLFFLMRSFEKGQLQAKGLQNIFFQKRDFNKKFLQLPKGTYSTLILGSSRTHRGIHPFYINKRLKQKAFKIAKAKVRLQFNYYFYQRYKEIAGIPKVIIYGLDYFMFKLKSNPYFMKWVARDPSVKKSAYNNSLLLLAGNKEWVDEFLNHEFERLGEMFTPSPGTTQFNLIDPFIGYRKVERTDKRRPAHFKRFDYQGYPGVEGEYFTKLLDMWKQDGVQVVLVYLPDYIGTYESNHQLDLFKAEIKRLTKPYSNVAIYDYDRPEEFALSNSDYFLDGGYGKTNSHLSLKGSRVFHRKFLKELKKHYR